VLVAEQGRNARGRRGRFIVQCGLGYDEAQFAAMGTTLKYRPSAFEESFAIVQRLLRGETVSSSRRFTFQDARLALRPPENVEYWIGASARPAIDRAARLAEGFLASPSLTLDEARDQAASHLSARSTAELLKAVAIRRDLTLRTLGGGRRTSQGRDPGDRTSRDLRPRRSSPARSRASSVGFRRARRARLH
jgi:hypothetical protein